MQVGAPKVGLCGCVLALALAIAPVSSAPGHDVRKRTRVTIEFHGFANPKLLDDFSGRVRSPWRRCERDRKVRVLRRVQGPAGDMLLGSARSEAFQDAPPGFWFLLWESPPPGMYYARVGRRNVGSAGHRHICRCAVSDTTTVP